MVNLFWCQLLSLTRFLGTNNSWREHRNCLCALTAVFLVLLKGVSSRTVGSGVSSIWGVLPPPHLSSNLPSPQKRNTSRLPSLLHCVHKNGCRATGSKSDLYCLKYIYSFFIWIKWSSGGNRFWVFTFWNRKRDYLNQFLLEDIVLSGQVVTAQLNLIDERLILLMVINTPLCLVKHW